MRNYTYHSRIVTELYREDALSRCEIITLHYDGSTDSHKMWMTTSMFNEAYDGDQFIRDIIDRSHDRLVKAGRI
jgi:hypothetical protein